MTTADGLSFCDVCGESVPRRDFERGVAVRRGSRVLCAHHAAEVREAAPSARSPLVSLVALVAVGGLAAAVAALVIAVRKPSTAEVDAAAESGRRAGEELTGRLAAAREDLRRALEDA